MTKLLQLPNLQPSPVAQPADETCRGFLSLSLRSSSKSLHKSVHPLGGASIVVHGSRAARAACLRWRGGGGAPAAAAASKRTTVLCQTAALGLQLVPRRRERIACVSLARFLRAGLSLATFFPSSTRAESSPPHSLYHRRSLSHRAPTREFPRSFPLPPPPPPSQFRYKRSRAQMVPNKRTAECEIRA